MKNDAKKTKVHWIAWAETKDYSCSHCGNVVNKPTQVCRRCKSIMEYVTKAKD